MTTSPLLGQITLGVYGVLLIAGGILGYVKARSRPSVIAGTISGLMAFGALAASTRDHLGFRLGAVLAALMLVVFGVRLARTRKFMPSGLLAVLSLAVLFILGFLAY